MLNNQTTLPMLPVENAALRPNMKAVFGPQTPFLAVSRFQRGFGGFRGFGDSRPVFAHKNKPYGGWFSRPDDLPIIQHSASNIQHSISPVPPFKKLPASTESRASRRIKAISSTKTGGGQHE